MKHLYNLMTYSAVYSSIWLFLNGSIVGHLNFNENKEEQQYASLSIEKTDIKHVNYYNYKFSMHRYYYIMKSFKNNHGHKKTR